MRDNKTKEKSTWLWYGDYVHPDVEREWARVELLAQIERHAPEVLEALARDVLPKYQAFIEAHTGPLPEPKWCWQPESEERAPGFANVRVALQDWAESYNLSPRRFDGPLTGKGSAWLLWNAFWTLHFWDKSPERKEMSFWAPAVLPDSPLPESELTVDFRFNYNPAFETKAAAVERIKTISAQLLKHLGAVEEKMKRAGWKCSTPKKEPERHYRWFVEYQVLGLSENQIAGISKTPGEMDAGTRPEFKRKSVSDGISSIASLLGAKLRPHDVGGRPKKGVR